MAVLSDKPGPMPDKGLESKLRYLTEGTVFKARGGDVLVYPVGPTNSGEHQYIVRGENVFSADGTTSVGDKIAETVKDLLKKVRAREPIQKLPENGSEKNGNGDGLDIADQRAADEGLAKHVEKLTGRRIDPEET